MPSSNAASRTFRAAATTRSPNRHEDQHLWSRLCRRGVARLPGPRRATSVIGVDINPAKLQLINDGKSPVVEEGMVELMAKVVAAGSVSRDRRRRCSRARQRGVADLRGHAVGPQRQPGPAARRCGWPSNWAWPCAAMTATTRVRVSLHAGARHGRRCAAAHPRKGVGQDGTASTSMSVSSPSSCAKARRSATTTTRRSRSSAPTRCPARTQVLRQLFGHLPCDFHVTSVPRGRDGEVLLQYLPRAEDHVRQRDGAAVRGAAASIRSK